MSRNDIIGDSIYTKDSRKYEDNWDRIFRPLEKVCHCCGEVVATKESVVRKGKTYHKDCLEDL